MKLYTKRGDAGMTDLFRGGRVRKDDPRVAAYGDVDELNAHLGLARAEARGEAEAAVVAPLAAVQSRLFDLGADLATPAPETLPQAAAGEEAGAGTRDPVHRIGPAEVAEVEGWIDAASAAATPLRTFVLPGGTELAARLHVARTVCRRAERSCVTLAAAAPPDRPVGPSVAIYLNRLSDLLFALARQANAAADVDDVEWVKADAPRDASG